MHTHTQEMHSKAQKWIKKTHNIYWKKKKHTRHECFAINDDWPAEMIARTLVFEMIVSEILMGFEVKFNYSKGGFHFYVHKFWPDSFSFLNLQSLFWLRWQKLPVFTNNKKMFFFFLVTKNSHTKIFSVNTLNSFALSFADPEFC